MDESYESALSTSSMFSCHPFGAGRLRHELIDAFGAHRRSIASWERCSCAAWFGLLHHMAPPLIKAYQSILALYRMVSSLLQSIMLARKVADVEATWGNRRQNESLGFTVLSFKTFDGVFGLEQWLRPVSCCSIKFKAPLSQWFGSTVLTNWLSCPKIEMTPGDQKGSSRGVDYKQ